MAQTTTAGVPTQRRPIIWIGLGVSIFLLLVLLVWLGVNFIWGPGEDSSTRGFVEGELAGVSLSAAARYSQVALLDAPGQTLELDFAPVISPTLPAITATAVISLSSGLTFGPAGGPSPRTLAIPLAATKPDDWRVNVVNDGQRRGVWRTPGQIDIRLCYPDAAGDCLATLTLRPDIEGWFGFHLRRFVTSTVNQASPLILLLTVAVPLVGVAAQREFEKWVDARREQQRRAFENDRQAFLQYICTGDAANAAARLKAMAASPHKDLAAADVELARHLLALATLSEDPFPEEERGSWPSRRVLEMAPREPRAFVAAACLAMRRLIEHQAAPAAAATKPLDHGWLRAVWNEARRIALEPDSQLAVQRDVVHRQVVLPRLYRSGQLLPDSRGSTRLGPALRFSVSRSLRTPFRNDDPAWERSFLREGVAFWGGHSLIERLKRSRGSLVIRGAAGTGRTTLAELLPYQNLFSPSILLVHLKSGTLPEKINELVATQLLNIVVDSPLYLGRFTDHQRDRLAAFLAAHLARHDIIDRLEERQIALGERGKPDDWDLETAGELLELFRRRFDAAGTDQPPPGEGDWAGVLQTAMRRMGYSRVVVIGEANSDSRTWIKALSQPAVVGRGAIRFWLFVNDDFQVDGLAGPPDMDVERLVWHGVEFRRMLEWRFEKYLDAMNPPDVPPRARHQALFRAFEDESAGLERLLAGSRLADGSYNPGRFMKLWAAAVGEKVWSAGAKITAADIDRALAEVGP